MPTHHLKQLIGATVFFFALAGQAAESKRPWTSPEDPQPEYGRGLTASDARNGWLSLFDGNTTFGWIDGEVTNGQFVGPAKTSCRFIASELRGEVARGGIIQIANDRYRLEQGQFKLRVNTTGPGAIVMVDGVSFNRLEIRPLGLRSVFNGSDLTGWKVLAHPRNNNVKADWTVSAGVLRAVGGPGALELQERLGDLTLQMEIRATTLSNGGLFFRAIPGDFMNGYEAQIFNACYDNDPAQPVRYSTGAIDDRQLARRLVSRDGEWLTMTVIANGPHIVTWVNGFQQVDWTDKRAVHENPRRGLRLQPGTIQIQAHDPQTDFEVRNIRVVENQDFNLR